MTLVLLESHTVAAAATLDFATRNAAGQTGPTIQSDYDEYLLELLGIIPATNAVELILRVGTGAGPAYDAGANYSWLEFRNVGGAGSPGGATGANGIRLVGPTDNLSNNAAWGFSGTGRLFTPSQGTLFPRFLYEGSHLTGGGSEENRTGCGAYTALTPITALRLLTSSGNLSGLARLFGLS